MVNPQIQQHLKALGYTETDRIFYRAINSDKPIKVQGTGFNIPINLERLNKDHGIYFVANGGGDTDKEVTHGKAIFYEHDDLPKELQLGLWTTLRLPEPTIQVDTGGKSIHSYWVFEAPIDIDIWKTLQSDLLEHADGDRSIKNPSRVMRLAGFKHLKTGEVSSIVSNSGRRYSLEELRAVIPVQQPKATSTPKPKPQKPISGNMGDIPLEKCISKTNRASLGGMNEGGRDSAMSALAMDLVGTERHLQAIGQRFEGSARQLLESACSRCNPPLTAKDVDRIYRSAEKSSNGPCLSENKIQGCIDAHYKVKRDSQSQPWRSGEGFRDKVVSINTGEPIASVEDAEEVEKDEVEKALELGKSLADIKALLPNLAPMLQCKADRFNVPIEGIAGMLLPLVASQMPSQIRLKIDGGYNVPPILWCGSVGDSGASKSPCLDVFSQPLTKLQAEEYGRYALDKKHYDKQYKEWLRKKEGEEPGEPDPLIHLYTSDFTIESVVKIVSEQADRGLAVVVDELAGFFNSFGEHKGGKGGDRQKWLSAYNGAAIKTDRKTTGTLMAARTSISIAGTIQPSTLKKLIGDVDEVDGLWPRMLWFKIPTTRMPAPGEVESLDMSETMNAVYLRLAAMPVQICEFDSEAKKVWVEWHNWTQDQKMGATSDAIRATYPKAGDQAARVALVAHYAEAAVMGVQPSATISAATLRAAICLVDYCINQARLIYGDLGATDENPEAIRIARIVERSAGQEVTYKQIRNTLPKVQLGRGKVRKANKAECLAFMEKLAGLGYATAIEPDFSKIRVVKPDSSKFQATESDVDEYTFECSEEAA